MICWKRKCPQPIKLKISSKRRNPKPNSKYVLVINRFDLGHYERIKVFFFLYLNSLLVPDVDWMIRNHRLVLPKHQKIATYMFHPNEMIWQPKRELLPKRRCNEFKVKRKIPFNSIHRWPPFELKFNENSKLRGKSNKNRRNRRVLNANQKF